MFFEKIINWNVEKNNKLKSERNISFEDILSALKKWNFMKVFSHPNEEQYWNQKILLIDINNYIYCVPYIEDENEIFFKTIFPSRKYTKLFLNK